MRAYCTLVWRELTAHFFSWAAYVIIAAVVFLIGLGFAITLKGLNGLGTPVPVTQLFYQTYCFWMILLIIPPVITMRTFALEKSSGTYETLMTTPVSEAQVVLAKFSGALIFGFIMWLPLLGCLFIVRSYSGESSALDGGAISSTFLGIFLLGALYTSMGVFASAITRSQIIAMMVGVGLGLSLFLLSFLNTAMSSVPGWAGELLAYMAVTEHMRDFSQGVVDTRPVIFCVTLTVLFLIWTWKAVETRRWK